MTKDHRLSKKELQANELQDALEGARDYVVSHEDQAKKWGIVAGVVVAAVALVLGVVAWRDRTLNARLSEAVALLDAPLITDGVPATPGVKVFKDAAERREAARKQLRELASSSSNAGRAARLLLLSLDASTAPSGANLDGARDLSKSPSGTISGGFAAATFLDAEAAAGRTKEAIAAAKEFLGSSSSPLPKDVLLYTLGRLQEKAGQTAEAKSSYQRLVADFPDSPMRFDVQQKLQGL